MNSPFKLVLAAVLICLGPGGRQNAQASGLHGVSVALSTSATATASGNSGAAVFSGDGRNVFFLSTAANLTTNGIREGLAHIFRRELSSGTTTLVSATANGRGGDGPVTAFSASADGRWVAFSSRASDLVPDDTNRMEDVFSGTWTPT